MAVVGVSPDKPSAQKKFDDKYELGFPLLADTEHAMAEAYGVWGEKSIYGKKYFGIIRSSFLIDEKGRIAGSLVQGVAGGHGAGGHGGARLNGTRGRGWPGLLKQARTEAAS